MDEDRQQPNAKVFKDDHGPPFKVRPGIARASISLGFQIENATENTLVVRLPPDVFQPNTHLEQHREEIEQLFPQGAKLLIEEIKWIAPGETPTFPIKPGAAKGPHTYHVFVRASGGLEQAEGNSAPKVIIDP